MRSLPEQSGLQQVHFQRREPEGRESVRFISLRIHPGMPDGTTTIEIAESDRGAGWGGDGSIPPAVAVRSPIRVQRPQPIFFLRSGAYSGRLEEVSGKIMGVKMPSGAVHARGLSFAPFIRDGGEEPSRNTCARDGAWGGTRFYYKIL